MSFLVRLNSGSLEKLELGAPSCPATLNEKFLQRIRVLVRGYFRVRFDLHSFINVRDISGLPKLGAQRVQSGDVLLDSTDMISY